MPNTTTDSNGLFALYLQLADAVQNIDARLGSIERNLEEMNKAMANDAIQQAAATVSAGLTTLQTDAQTAYTYLQTQLAGPDDVQAVTALSAQVQQMDAAIKTAVPAAFPVAPASSGSATPTPSGS
jgi:hypothetical protein